MKTLPVILQVYSVRDFAEKDLEGTLKKVKEMGYDGVELAGLYGNEPARFRKTLDACGLSAVSAHVPVQEMIGDAEATVSNYKTVGCRFIAIPWLSPEMSPGGADFDKTLAVIKKTGAICKDNGITLLYHNHDFEFITLPDGRFGLDALFDGVPADLLQTEIDTCWVKVVGQDPAAYVKKYANRCPIVHLKDFVKENDTFAFCPVGHGCQDFAPVLEAALAGGAQYVVVEQDRSPERPSLEAAKMSREYLKSIGY